MVSVVEMCEFVTINSNIFYYKYFFIGYATKLNLKGTVDIEKKNTKTKNKIQGPKFGIWRNTLFLKMKLSENKSPAKDSTHANDWSCQSHVILNRPIVFIHEFFQLLYSSIFKDRLERART